MGSAEDLVVPLVEILRWNGVPCEAVADVQRLSGGASRETYSFDVIGDEGTVRQLVLQRTRPGTVGGAPMHLEAQLLRAAHAGGVPVPLVIASSPPSGSGDGARDALGSSWFIVERIAGETIARRILRDDEFAIARPQVIAQAAAALAAIHRLDPALVPGLVEVDTLQQMRQLIDGLGVALPAFELAFRWLEAHRPSPRPSAVVHGDFRLGNLMVGSDGLRSVLDWELAHLGDPLEDLGWLCVRAWRFGEPLPVAGLSTREDLFTAYEAARGDPVDPEAARWWEVLGTLRWGAICLLQADVHLSGASRSVELAAIGRRTCETEYDLFLLLEDDDLRRAAVAASADSDLVLGSPGAVHGRPTVAELVEAVREFLEGDVQAVTEGRARFHTRVSAKVLAMVERELTLGPAQAARHAERLGAIGVPDEKALAEAIRAASIDTEAEPVRITVWSGVLDKVRVANPSYLDEGDALGSSD